MNICAAPVLLLVLLKLAFSSDIPLETKKLLSPMAVGLTMSYQGGLTYLGERNSQVTPGPFEEVPSYYWCPTYAASTAFIFDCIALGFPTSYSIYYHSVCGNLSKVMQDCAPDMTTPYSAFSIGAFFHVLATILHYTTDRDTFTVHEALMMNFMRSFLTVGISCVYLIHPSGYMIILVSILLFFFFGASEYGNYWLRNRLRSNN